MREPRLSSEPLGIFLALVLGTSAAMGQGVGPEFRVNSYTPYSQQKPSIASGSTGNFVVVWQSYGQDGRLDGVFGQRYDAGGGPLGSEFRVNSYTSSKQLRPSVAADPDGNFVVVWFSYALDGSGSGIFGQRYASAGSPLGTEFQVNTFTTGYQFYPSVASDSHGNFVVVWTSVGQASLSADVFGQRYDMKGKPLGAEFLVDTLKKSAQQIPSVARDAGGNFLVVWQSSQDGSNYAVRGRRYSSTGSTLGAEFRVNTYTTGYRSIPIAAGRSGGTFIVVWRSFGQDGTCSAFGQRYGSSGAPLGGEFRVNASTTRGGDLPFASSDSEGNFVVVWEGGASDGSFGIFGRRYSSSGAPLGGEFQANTYTQNGRNRAAVATGPGGHFVVVWQSAQDGFGYGVFGQRFCPALSSVTVGVSGATTVCTTSTGGTATVTDADGGLRTHQWGYRTVPGGPTTPIAGQTSTSYLIDGSHFPGPGFYYLVCATFPECGTTMFSNEIVIVVNPDPTAPAVTPPQPIVTTQTLCM